MEKHRIFNGQLVLILFMPAVVVGVWRSGGTSYGLVSLGTAAVSFLVCVFIWGPLVLEIYRQRKELGSYDKELDAYDELRGILEKLPSGMRPTRVRKWLRDHPQGGVTGGNEEAK